jgi:hypothetical protein
LFNSPLAISAREFHLPQTYYDLRRRRVPEFKWKAKIDSLIQQIDSSARCFTENQRRQQEQVGSRRAKAGSEKMEHCEPRLPTCLSLLPVVAGDTDPLSFG